MLSVELQRYPPVAFFFYTWIKICDLKGWNGKIAKDYNVFATPMMFLLNENLKIVAKPVNVRELEKKLKERL